MMGAALKSDRDTLKGDGEALNMFNGDREALKRTLRSYENASKDDKPCAKGR